MSEIISELTSNTQARRFQCHHHHADGRTCGSPALRHEEFCFYHHPTRKPAPHPRVRRGRQTFDLPLPAGNDPAGLQLALAEVLRRIAGNQITPRRAGLLLYGLQTAALTSPTSPPPTPPSRPWPTLA